MTQTLKDATPSHPAQYSDGVMKAIHSEVRRRVDVGSRLLDPFAGLGNIHALAPEYDTHGVELEPEWAASHARTVEGDATDLPFENSSFDAVVTSPCYGNRMADTYLGDRKGSKRHTYTIALGRVPSDGSAAAMQWGPEYRNLHKRAWREAHRVIVPGGFLFLNISDHIRSRTVQPVSIWHTATLCEIGFSMVDCLPVMTRRQRHGANGNLRVDNEWLIVFSKDPF